MNIEWEKIKEQTYDLEERLIEKGTQGDTAVVKTYSVGSGVVESTCGYTVKNRMEGTGRRWSIKGAESTLLLRSVYTSSDWNAYWRLIEKSN